MNLIRSDLELWLIVEQNFEKNYDQLTKSTHQGLCNVINILCDDYLITVMEAKHLKNVISKYKEQRNVNILEIYIWKPLDRKPRRMFIQKQILKAIRNENRIFT